MGAPPPTMDAMLQEREAEAKHHEMEAARREAAEKAREYEGVRAEVLCYSWLMPVACLNAFLPGASLMACRPHKRPIAATIRSSCVYDAL